MPALDGLFPMVFVGIVISYFTIVVLAFVFLMKLRKGTTTKDSSVQSQVLHDEMLQYFRYEVSQLKDSFQKDLMQLYNELHMQLMQDRESFATYLGQVMQEMHEAKQEQVTKMSEGMRDVPRLFQESLDQSRRELFVGLNQKLESEYSSLRQEFKDHVDNLAEGYKHDVSESKERVIKHIEQSLTGFAQNALREYAAEALSDQDHERIILHALSRAREEGLFRGV